MLDESQTWDEGIHLAAGYRYLTTGDSSFSPEHPPLGRALNALPLLALDLSLDPNSLTPPVPQAGFRFVFRNSASPRLILNFGRSVTVALTLAFAAWLALWTHRRFGPAAALIALALFCFDPNIIAHGRYVTTDLIAAALIFLACTLWLDSRHLAAGLALGAALASKNSALFLIPVFIAAGLILRRGRALLITFAAAAATLLLVYTPELVRGNWWYVTGIRQLLEQNSVGEPAYLLGQISQHGWWYYFPVAFLVKTPAGLLLAAAASALLVWRLREHRRWAMALAAIATAYMTLCMFSGITIGHRHLLPIYPFLFVLAGIVLSHYRKLAVALVLLVAVESLAVFPHYLAFFNWPSGGPRAGPKYLVDSNLDWGQDAGRLGQYLSRNRIGRVCLSYFGNADLLYHGVEYTRVPARPEDADCVVAISATPLHGLYVGRETYAWLRARKPTATIGHSIYLYDLRRRPIVSQTGF